MIHKPSESSYRPRRTPAKPKHARQVKTTKQTEISIKLNKSSSNKLVRFQNKTKMKTIMFHPYNEN